MEWTPEQDNFISEVETTHNSIRLDAVAGSGKTTVLVGAAEHIPSSETTIALAFNKKIADTLKEKFPAHIQCKTFNGLGSQVWTRARGRIKLSSRKIGALTSLYCKEHNLGDEWHTIRALVCQLKSSGVIHPELEEAVKGEARILDQGGIYELAAHHDIEADEDIIRAALAILLISTKQAATTSIDFDDQIYMSTYFAPDSVWTKYDNILVDESQDLSEMQHDMLARMGAGSGARVIIVGDPHQAIYGWRGAASDSMDQLEERFSLKKMPLSICFRCPPEVVEVAQRSVPHITSWSGKPSGTVESLDQWDVDSIKLGSVVLCRNNAPLVALAFKLLAENTPAYFSGRNLGAGLKADLKKIGGESLGNALATWRDYEVDKALVNEQFDKADKIEDTYEVLECIRIAQGSENKRDLERGIDYLFRKEYSPEAIELSTIHRAKGKEWNTVYFLYPHLVPGRWVKKAFDEEKPCGAWMMEQEENLRYVCVTRALEHLVFLKKEEE